MKSPLKGSEIPAGRQWRAELDQARMKSPLKGPKIPAGRRWKADLDQARMKSPLKGPEILAGRRWRAGLDQARIASCFMIMEDASIFLTNNNSYETVTNAYFFSSIECFAATVTTATTNAAAKISYKDSLTQGNLGSFINENHQNESIEHSILTSNLDADFDDQIINITLSSSERERLKKQPIPPTKETPKEDENFGPCMVVQSKRNKKMNQGEN
ncbi:hypothetical protein COLO4_16167 [Corchorus olitorius]|uniref:Uncharacterized protein n=1 Tax=Corchorus olitorius TaxID=93759 RepID=A0A1R3JIR2_9ROSI|nr:hypothetical protein COLO4_16167 [Corchorus olitorius]